MFYLINKKKGISSFKAIREFAKKRNIKKVGHTGTLDPMATGLLLIATDDDTKLIDYIDKGEKSYIASMILGADSDTLDIEGNVVKVDLAWDESKVEEIIMSFEKTYDQMPPDFSAKKVNGKRAYELAREGKEVKLNTSKVTISNITNIKKVSEKEYQFEVTVSRGTYIRSLIKDIGEALGTKAIMSSLVRNKLAGFTLNDADSEVNELDLVSLKKISIMELKDLFNGKPVQANEPDGSYALEFKKRIIGIIKIKSNQVSERKLFGNKYERISNESN